jgi:hypothetical protein
MRRKRLLLSMIMPGQQVIDTRGFVLDNAAEEIGKPSLRINLFELRRLNEG